MRLVLELFLISAMVLGSALGAQEENGVLVFLPVLIGFDSSSSRCGPL